MVEILTGGWCQDVSSSLGRVQETIGENFRGLRGLLGIEQPAVESLWVAASTSVQHIVVRCQWWPRSKANVLGSDLTMVFGLLDHQAHFWWHSLVRAASDAAHKQQFNSPAFKLE